MRSIGTRGRRIVVRVVVLGELAARVAASYGKLAMPTWPNPHPGMTPAREEEYSRVTDPERYGIVHARARAWSAHLGELPGVRVETLAPAPLDAEGRMGRFDRGVRLASPRPGTLPLLLLERDAPVPDHAAPLAVLHVSVARPEVAVTMQPYCGCDACDTGSDDLLDAVDQAIGSVVGGPYVALRGAGWHAQWHSEGGSSGGDERAVDHNGVMELCRRLAAGQDVRLPEGTEAYVGRGWLD